jgi:hypothetical protein
MRIFFDFSNLTLFTHFIFNLASSQNTILMTRPASSLCLPPAIALGLKGTAITSWAVFSIDTRSKIAYTSAHKKGVLPIISVISQLKIYHFTQTPIIRREKWQI